MEFKLLINLQIMSRDEKIAEIRSLINQAMIDGVITESEVEKIFKKAQEYGVMDECEQFLENAQRKLNKQKADDKHRSNMNKIKYGLIIGGVFFFIFIVYKGCFYVSDEISKEGKSYKTLEEALSAYDFVAARKLVDYDPFNEELQTIIKAEITYYCTNNAYDKALASLTEYKFKQTYSEQFEGSSKDQYYYNKEAEQFNNLLDALVTKLALAGQKEQAISYLNAYAVGKAAYLHTTNNISYFKRNFSWRDERIKAIKQMK